MPRKYKCLLMQIEPAAIKSIQIKLCLSNRDASILFSVRIETYGRWTKGTQIPHENHSDLFDLCRIVGDRFDNFTPKSKRTHVDLIRRVLQNRGRLAAIALLWNISLGATYESD